MATTENKTGEGLFQFALAQVGTPYYYGAKLQILTEQLMAKMSKAYPNVCNKAYNALARAKKQVGRINTDCSGLEQGYTKKALGSAQLYSQAYTRMDPSTYKDWADGVVVWRNGHVGTFGWLDGEPVVVEAKGIAYGTIISKYNPKKWKAGLTFSWLSYTYAKNVENKTWKKPNPYDEPKVNLKKGTKGDTVRWLQYELVESGYSITIDGDFGKNTDKALRKFQQSSKLTVDGICGSITRRALKAV